MKVLKLIISFFILISLTSNVYSQKLTSYLITSNSIGSVKLGMTIDEFKQTHEHMKVEVKTAWHYGVDGEGEGWVVSDSEEELLFVWSKNETTIGGIYCLSEKFSTSQGIKIGMKIKSLVELYPELVLEQNMSNERNEYFAVEIDPKNEKMPNPFGWIIAEFYSYDRELVGDYSEVENYEMETTKFDTERAIDKIAIWD
jgi:hypothetical protein